MQVPGFPGVMNTTFDPTTNIYSGGTRTYNNADGTKTNAYQIYNINTSGTFGKANGLGGLAAFCQSAPIELGDRVWVDSNGNGLQDANEADIANVTVHLYAADGTTLLQTTTTDANGNYVFTISPYTSYVIKLDSAADYASNGPLHGYELTTSNQDSGTHSTDSNTANTLLAAGTRLPIITVTGTIGIPDSLSPVNNVTVSTPTEGNVSNNTASNVIPVRGPDLTIVKTHQGGNSFQVGQIITYNLQVSNAATGGPIFAGEPVTVTDALPRGINAVQAHGNGWHIKLTSTRGITTVVATYAGGYPIASGAHLPVIIVTGRLTNDAAGGNLLNSATVATPLDIKGTHHTSNNLIVVERQPDLFIRLSRNAMSCAKIKQLITYQVLVRVLPGIVRHAPLHAQVVLHDKWQVYALTY
jgi:uncharacterized repeat protein (TIGR01451 family)